MTDLTERKQKANGFRKAGDYETALELYRDLWRETGDMFDGAGLLHCLRKLELFEEAFNLAEELIAQYPDFDWSRNEVIWTLISGKLYKLEEHEPLGEVIQTAQKIIDLNPDDLARKAVVFKVLKSAKASNNWETVNEWVVKIEPNSLSAEPMTDSLGRKGWSDQALWYNYRVNGLIKKGNFTDAITLIDEILETFPGQRKFFLRLKASANHLLGNLPEAEEAYQELCESYKPDWWLLHEYAKVIRDRGRENDALKLMYQAASRHSKLQLMVSLFEDIGILCMKMGKYEEARAHLVLSKYVRQDKGWNIKEEIETTVDDLNNIVGDNKEPSSLKEALIICQSEWSELLEEEIVLKGVKYENREVKKGLVGTISLGRDDRPYCFIITNDGLSIFCSKSILPPSVMDGDEVCCDAVPSFDKKKNKESWKASNVRLRT
jgi:tetratricopeptide (TPR) repeat protein